MTHGSLPRLGGSATNHSRPGIDGGNRERGRFAVRAEKSLIQSAGTEFDIMKDDAASRPWN